MNVVPSLKTSTKGNYEIKVRNNSKTILNSNKKIRNDQGIKFKKILKLGKKLTFNYARSLLKPKI